MGRGLTKDEMVSLEMDKLEDMRMGWRLKQRLSPAENTIMNSKREMFAKLDYAENQYSRANILIDGIKDDQEETWSESKTVQQTLSSNQGLCGTNIGREYAQRIGPCREGGEAQEKTVVKLWRFKARQWILLLTKELKRTNKWRLHRARVDKAGLTFDKGRAEGLEKHNHQLKAPHSLILFYQGFWHFTLKTFVYVFKYQNYILIIKLTEKRFGFNSLNYAASGIRFIKLHKSFPMTLGLALAETVEDILQVISKKIDMGVELHFIFRMQIRLRSGTAALHQSSVRRPRGLRQGDWWK